MFASVAHAMGAPGGAGGSGDAMMQFMPLVLMLLIFYFLLIRPQQKRAKEHKAMLQALKKGDMVLTNAGFLGRILDVEEEMLTLDLGETRVQLARSYVAALSTAKLAKPGGKKESRPDAARKEAKEADKEEARAEAADAESAPRDPDDVDKV